VKFALTTPFEDIRDAKKAALVAAKRKRMLRETRVRISGC